MSLKWKLALLSLLLGVLITILIIGPAYMHQKEDVFQGTVNFNELHQDMKENALQTKTTQGLSARHQARNELAYLHWFEVQEDRRMEREESTAEEEIGQENTIEEHVLDVQPVTESTPSPTPEPIATPSSNGGASTPNPSPSPSPITSPTPTPTPSPDEPEPTPTPEPTPDESEPTPTPEPTPSPTPEDDE